MGPLIALLGLLAGGMLNFLADRLPVREVGWQGPTCPYCDAPRPPREWLSLLAYLQGRWRCHHCGAHFPLRVPLVEAGTVVLFIFLWILNGASWSLVLQIVYSWILLLVMVIDSEHRLIPNRLIYPALALAAVTSFFHPERGAQWFWVGGVFGFVFVYGIYLLGALFGLVVSRRRGQPLREVVFGAGDVKLAAFIGLVVGFPEVIFALVLGILLGGLAALGYLLFQFLVRRQYVAFSPMPYGPFMVAGAWVMLWFGPEVLRWYLGT